MYPDPTKQYSRTRIIVTLPGSFLHIWRRLFFVLTRNVSAYWEATSCICLLIFGLGILGCTYDIIAEFDRYQYIHGLGCISLAWRILFHVWEFFLNCICRWIASLQSARCPGPISVLNVILKQLIWIPCWVSPIESFVLEIDIHVPGFFLKF